MMLRRGLRTLTSLRGCLSFVSTPPIYRSFSTKSPSTSPPPSNAVAMSSSAATILTEEDLLIDDDDAAVSKTDTIPTLLQHGVVVYDGVCHLCHKGTYFYGWRRTTSPWQRVNRKRVYGEDGRCIICRAS
ncbi:PREDICTED: uncharacterized protein LOC109185323 [Ipomoea nil]|uniref:uncharacterized protein LOC109185323 n=1 Tax=Ipomoea nil TaxID=35883 RepID=UPI00090182B1|nr:PREDICTED: uncharacterized protein LOC109185323 [Ipomoea nil]